MAVWTEEQKIVPEGGPIPGGLLGGVAISGDGATIAAGAQFEGSEGRVYVFVRSGTTWTQQDVLAPAAADLNQQFGLAVALSTDGNTLAVGGPSNVAAIPSPGAVWIFTRSGTTWTEQEKITVTVPSYLQIDPIDGDDQEYNASRFGIRVALSGDGDRLLVGDPVQGSVTHPPGDEFTYIDPDQGPPGCQVVYVVTDVARLFGCFYSFSRSGVTWTEDERIEPDDGFHAVSGPQVGFGLAITPDGASMIVGGPVNAAVNQSTYVFTDPCENEFERVDADSVFYGAWWLGTESGGWTLGAKNLNPTPANAQQEGRSVDISDDAETRLVAGRRVYVETDSTFDELAFAESGDQLFEPVALLGDATLAVIGGSQSGGVYVFEDDGGWSGLFGGILVPPDIVGDPDDIALGFAVAADSGTRFVFTAPFDDPGNANGAIWVYSREVDVGDVSLDHVRWRAGEEAGTAGDPSDGSVSFDRVRWRVGETTDGGDDPPEGSVGLYEVRWRVGG